MFYNISFKIYLIHIEILDILGDSLTIILLHVYKLNSDPVSTLCKIYKLI